MSRVSIELQKETWVEVWENTSQQESVFTAFLNSPKLLQRTCFLFLKKKKDILFTLIIKMFTALLISLLHEHLVVVVNFC